MSIENDFIVSSNITIKNIPLSPCCKIGLPNSRHFASRTPFSWLLSLSSLCCVIFYFMLPLTACSEFDIFLFFGLLAGVIVVIVELAEVVLLIEASPVSQF